MTKYKNTKKDITFNFKKTLWNLSEIKDLFLKGLILLIRCIIAPKGQSQPQKNLAQIKEDIKDG